MARKRMKIIRTIESFYPFVSGPANQAFRISKELEKMGISSPVLTTFYKAEKSPAHERMDGVDVFRFPIRLSFMKYFYTPSMRNMLKDFDVVHAHSYRSYQTELAYKMARKQGKKFILHNHGSLMGYKSFVKGWKKWPYLAYDIFHKNIALDADAVIVNTKQESDEAVAFGVPKNKIHIIPVGIDAELYTPRPRTWKELRLLFVGRISRDRNITPVIRAVKILADKGTDVKLRIVGEAVKRTETEKGDYYSELKALVKELKLEKKVSFEGAKYGAELREYYLTSDIFVYTSLWENFGQTILEAAAAGLPLICTPVGVALDLIEEGKTGKIVGFEDEKGVAKAMLKFKDEDKRKKAAEKIRNKIKDEFNWQKIIESYLKIYQVLTKLDLRSEK
jgi:glycosyltransferase involved in cell wall biosynthesis